LNAIIQKDHARRHETSEISEGNKSASREWQRNASTDSNIGMQPVKTKPTATGDDGRKGQMTKSKGTHNARDACSTHKESIVKPDASTSNGQSRRIHSSTAVETGREATRRVNIKASTAGRLSEGTFDAWFLFYRVVANSIHPGPTFVEDGNPLWEPVIIVAAHGRKPRTGVVDSTKKGRFTQVCSNL